VPLDHFSLIAPVYARARYHAIGKMSEFATLPVQGRLLDVGGGTGRVASALCALADEIVVTDISMGMLKKAPRPALVPAACSSEFLPFPNDTFERVIMVDALHHVLDQKASACEMLRVLKPGGLLVIEEPDIRTFGVKWIAVGEKLLWMRSHFLSPVQIEALFPQTKTRIHTEGMTAWIVVEKLQTNSPAI
jgi:demethylmenaquinone methyltransferase/2-methoxy-6-polyprenyl-1,4-benzoquinol methylase